jgi:hypothetical protein
MSVTYRAKEAELCNGDFDEFVASTIKDFLSHPGIAGNEDTALNEPAAARLHLQPCGTLELTFLQMVQKSMRLIKN